MPAHAGAMAIPRPPPLASRPVTSCDWTCMDIWPTCALQLARTLLPDCSGCSLLLPACRMCLPVSLTDTYIPTQIIWIHAGGWQPGWPHHDSLSAVPARYCCLLRCGVEELALACVGCIPTCVRFCCGRPSPCGHAVGVRCLSALVWSVGPAACQREPLAFAIQPGAGGSRGRAGAAPPAGLQRALTYPAVLSVCFPTIRPCRDRPQHPTMHVI